MAYSNRYKIVLGAALTLLVMTQITLPTYGQESPSKTITFQNGTIKLDNIKLEVQLAQTGEQQTRGLMFQKQLPYDQGMLFIFDYSQIIGIWMMNMQFPLDIIWFDDKGNVVFIQKNAPPCKSTDDSTCPVMNPNDQFGKYVLEVTSGFVDKFNITKTSKLDLTSITLLSSTAPKNQTNISSTVPEFSSGVFILILSIVSVTILSRSLVRLNSKFMM